MTAFNLADATLGDTFDMSAQGNGERGSRWSHDGTKFYMASGSTTVIYQYTASTAFAVGSLSYSGNSKNLGADRRLPSWKSDGTRMFLRDGGTTVYQWNLSTAWDITTATDSGNTLDVSAQEPNPTGIDISDDGAYLFVTGVSNDTIVRYELSTPGDLSTAAYSGNNLSVSGDTPTVADLVVATGGLYFMYGQGAGDHTWIRKIATAFDPSSGSAPSGSSNRDLTGLVGGTYRQSDLNPTGTKLYIVRDPVLYELVMTASGRWTVGSIRF